MAKKKQKTMADIIRDTIHRDGRSMYRLALDSGVDSAVLIRFINGDRDMNLRTADRVCKTLGLGLTEVKER